MFDFRFRRMVEWQGFGCLAKLRISPMPVETESDALLRRAILLLRLANNARVLAGERHRLRMHAIEVRAFGVGR